MLSSLQYHFNNTIDQVNCAASHSPFSLLTGFGEENIKRQLQAVAEGVAASVLQSPFPEKPAALSGDLINHGAVVDTKVQVGDVSIYAGLTHCSLSGCNLLL